MRIEIDTKHDTKEELAHLANMLNALSGDVKGSFVDNRFNRRLDRKLGKLDKARKQEKPKDIFADPNPTAGFLNIFGDNSQDTTRESTQQSSTGITQTTMTSNNEAEQGSQDLFSIFGSAGTRANDSASTDGSPKVETYGGTEKKEDDDVLKDIRIVPY